MELEKAIMCTIGVCIFGSETNLLRDANRDGFEKNPELPTSVFLFLIFQLSFRPII